MSTIIFKKQKNPLRGFEYVAEGEFRKNVTFIRIRKNKQKDWSLVVFKYHEPKGEFFCKCLSLKDAKETSEQYFSI